MKRILLPCLILFNVAIAYSQENNVITSVDSETFKHVMDSLDGEVIVDLRTPDELKQGKIPGAIVIDFFGPDFEPAIRSLDRDKVYLVYCAGGGRSSETAAMMNELGFKKIYNLEEGFNGWVRKKMPVKN